MQVDFDPDVISFSTILEKFSEWHNPFRKPYSRQYMSAVLYHDSQQELTLRTFLSEIEKARGQQVRTEVAPCRGMTLAEDYHQKYYLRRNRDAAREFKAMYPALNDFVNSTAVMRVNAHLGNHLELSVGELAGFGLSDEVQKALLGTGNKKESPRLL